LRARADTLCAVRWMPLLLLLIAPAAAQETDRAADDHDKYGFPLRFDAEVITLNDLVRGAGLDSVEQMGNIANERDKLLMEKLTEKVGQLYGLEVEDRDVNDWIERQIANFPSEAEFYDSLAQKGQTLEIYRQEVKRQVLSLRLGQLIEQGFVPQGRRLLPWDPNPSPREVKIAFRNDPKRRAAGAQVLWSEVTVSLTDKERKKIYAKRMLDPDISDEDLRKEEAAILEPRLAQARAALEAGKTVAELGAELELEVLEKAMEIDSEPQASPLVAFLQSAKEGDQSGLLDIGQARFLVVRVKEISRPDQLSLNNPAVVEHYRSRIAALKQEKATAILRLRALDKSSIEPPRVRVQLRELVLANLRQAHRELRSLGIH